MTKRGKFVVVFEHDLDMIQGWGHSEADWHALAMHDFKRQSHYNTSARVISSTDTRDVFGGWASMADGWIEVTNDDRPVDPETEVQFITAMMEGNFYAAWKGWIKAEDVWVPERNGMADARITHYRTRNPNPATIPDPDDSITTYVVSYADSMYPEDNRIYEDSFRTEKEAEDFIDTIRSDYPSQMHRNQRHYYDIKPIRVPSIF